jgi:pimeloyl-ACP methyl ester carboxylesterase
LLPEKRRKRLTAVFIHGVPDTKRVWDRLVQAIARGDVVVLELPGFGCDRPAGFDASKEAYLAWLIATLEALPRPLDLVAHDWGSILAMRVLSVRPDLVRSWVAGGAPFTPDYTWHTTARIWQTEGAGEKAMERFTQPLAIDMLRRAGLSEAAAAGTARGIDDRMKASILRLYRSGRDVFETWGAALTIPQSPGLVLWGERDIYAAPIYGGRLAEVTGARAVTMDSGHWWQVEQPKAAAAEIVAFWKTLAR